MVGAAPAFQRLAIALFPLGFPVPLTLSFPLVEMPFCRPRLYTSRFPVWLLAIGRPISPCTAGGLW